jgi:hypothetical protein
MRYHSIDVNEDGIYLTGIGSVLDCKELAYSSTASKRQRSGHAVSILNMV